MDKGNPAIQPGPRKIILTDRLVADALAQAAADAIEAHRRAGLPLVVWGDGKPVLISPDEAAPSRRKVEPGGQRARNR